MAIKTADSHVFVALNLQDKIDSTYLSIARESRWIDDSNPPEETPETQLLDNVQGYKKAKQVSLVRPLKDNEVESTIEYPVVTYNQTKWAIIPNDKAYEEGARWLYFETEIFPGDLPNAEYRQVGIHVDLKPKQGVQSASLTPDEVEDTGILLIYENKEPQRRTSSVYVLEQFILKV